MLHLEMSEALWQAVILEFEFAAGLTQQMNAVGSQKDCALFQGQVECCAVKW